RSAPGPPPAPWAPGTPTKWAVWTHLAGAGPSLGCFPPPGLLTPLLAAATAARERATPPGGSTPDPSAQRPSLGSAAATSWLSPSRGSAGAVATARVGWHGASRNYSRHGTRLTAGVSRPHLYTAWRPAVPPPPHAR